MTTPNGGPSQPDQPPGLLDPPELEASEQSLYERFMALVPDVRSEMGVLEDRRAIAIRQHQARRDALQREHQSVIAEIDGEKRTLLGLLKALGEDPPPTAGKKKGKARAQNISDAKLLMVLEAILNESAERFTVLGISERLDGVKEPSVNAAFNHLRAIEFIGKAGEENRPNGGTLWRILPNGREVGEKLKASLTTKDKTPKVPSAAVLQRHIDAIEALGKPEFAALEISDKLGQASPKGTYTVVNYMCSVNYLTEAGKTPGRAADGSRPRQLYRIDNESALNEILGKEPVNA